MAGATLTGAPTNKMMIQWQRNGADIPGATNTTYTTPLLTLSDDGAQFQTVFAIPGLAVTSAVATITMNSDFIPPAVIAPPSFAPSSVLRMTIFFSELLNPATATNLANYVFANGVGVTNAVLYSNQTVQLTVTNLPQNANYSLAISGVQDLAGNPNATTNLTGNVGFYELNFALSGIATQSSTAWGGVASRAIDGNTDGVFGDGSCTHSADPPSETNRFWEVDLGAVMDFARLSVWFRTDCCWFRNTNFTLLVLAADRTELLRTNYPGADYPPANTIFDLAAPVSGRYVRFEPGSVFEQRLYAGRNAGHSRLLERRAGHHSITARRHEHAGPYGYVHRGLYRQRRAAGQGVCPMAAQWRQHSRRQFHLLHHAHACRRR